ncbi:MAG: hypothetical protein FIB08_16915 [Candidatus Methanoperedens sp.]|nr:hypothetical protein [Candidatus Methanoperedens sp.]
MNNRTKYAIFWLVVITLIITVINLQLNRPSQEDTIIPPPAILTIGGKEQISGIGTYCWNEAFFRYACADYSGIPTPEEPLNASRQVAAHLSLPIKTPPQQLGLQVIRVTESDSLELRSEGQLVWQPGVGKELTLPLESEQDVNLALEPGLYVIRVLPAWKEEGNVSYGFLVKVE